MILRWIQLHLKGQKKKKGDIVCDLWTSKLSIFLSIKFFYALLSNNRLLHYYNLKSSDPKDPPGTYPIV